MHRQLNQEVENFILNVGVDFVGFAKIKNQNSLLENLTTAVSVGIVYRTSVTHLKVKDLHEYIASTKTKMAFVLGATEQYLHERNYKTWIPQISETIGNLSSTFSHKMAATMSGLGWIGKNSIFISSQFGCGSRLATIFTDVAVAYGKPVTKSQCGSCDECVKACPCNAIKGGNWYAGISRDTLIDPWLCKKYRDSFKNKLGFSHPCCLCIKSCPLANPPS